MAMEWAAEDVGGRVPLAVTVAEATVPGQIEMVGAAKALGAGWVILQPPPVSGLPEAEYVSFFGAVAERERKGVGQGKGVSVRVDLGGRRIIKQKKTPQHH